MNYNKKRTFQEICLYFHKPHQRNLSWKKIYIWFFGTFLSFVTFIPITFIMSIVIKLHQVYWILTVQRHSTYHHKDVRAMIIFQMMHQCVMQIYTLVSMQYFGFLFFQVACLQHDNQLITFGVVAGLTG